MPVGPEHRAQEEDPHRVQSQSGLPVGVDFRPEAVPQQLGESGPGGVPAAHRDPGEDLVPEPEEQVEETAGRRLGAAGVARSSSHDDAENRQGPHSVPRDPQTRGVTWFQLVLPAGVPGVSSTARHGGLLELRQLPFDLLRSLHEYAEVTNDWPGLRTIYVILLILLQLLLSFVHMYLLYIHTDSCNNSQGPKKLFVGCS